MDYGKLTKNGEFDIRLVFAGLVARRARVTTGVARLHFHDVQLLAAARQLQPVRISVSDQN